MAYMKARHLAFMRSSGDQVSLQHAHTKPQLYEANNRIEKLEAELCDLRGLLKVFVGKNQKDKGATTEKKKPPLVFFPSTFHLSSRPSHANSRPSFASFTNSHRFGGNNDEDSIPSPPIEPLE
ncbi:hypothetical protein PFISCL1PPCAC_6666 [Pristionchus fissidentatus]|uniref:Uncharacterized protein n=1 Tax=Pristionchus fissidentatus TaxID=1538716 RepID=A0AAV5VC10_9BILA|nr:hypothetical protein PFISCL1PPCAC_6666 [Pristionchus fissidentatus]